MPAHHCSSNPLIGRFAPNTQFLCNKWTLAGKQLLQICFYLIIIKGSVCLRVKNTYFICTGVPKLFKYSQSSPLPPKKEPFQSTVTINGGPPVSSSFPQITNFALSHTECLRDSSQKTDCNVYNLISELLAQIINVHRVTVEYFQYSVFSHFIH